MEKDSFSIRGESNYHGMKVQCRKYHNYYTILVQLMKREAVTQ